MVTSALSSSVAVFVSLSATSAVTVSVCVSPASPVTVPVKLHVYVAPIAMLPPVAHVPWPFRSPNTSSVNVSSVTASGEVFSTSTVKVTSPPGSSIEVTPGVLVTVSVGVTSSMPTSALSSSVAVFVSLSETSAVTVSVCVSPASPVTVPVKLHVYVAPIAMLPPVAHVPWPFRSPNTSSVNVSSVTASGEVFSTSTVKVTSPPGSSIEVTPGVFVTVNVGRMSITVTSSSSSGSCEAGVSGSWPTVPLSSIVPVSLLVAEAVLS